MRIRIMSGLAIAAILVTVGLVSPASSAEAQPHYRSTVTVKTWAFDGIAKGKLLSTSSSSTDGGPVALSASDIIHGGTPSASGCRSYTQDIEDLSTLHLTKIYRITQRYSWCWFLTHVYNQTMSRDVTNVAGNWSYEGVISSYSEFYSYHGFYHAGYRWYRKFHLRGGCIAWVCQDEYPWMKFWSHADGTYSIQEDNA